MALSIINTRRASPVKVLSTIWLIVPVFCILVYLFNRSTPYPSQTLGPTSKASVYKVNWNNTLPPSSTAYAYTYFTGRHDDTQRFIATLTSIQALRGTTTTRDIVVMIDNKVTTDQIQAFKKHGAIVHAIPEVDLFSTKDTTTLPLGEFCYSNFAPIYTWSLTQYERVIWLDADVLPQMIMDELFLCGEFCMIHANLQWYIYSMFVVKPSKTKFIELFNNLANRGVMAGKLRQLQSNFWPTITECQDLFEEFLFQSMYHIESAPLFDPEGPDGQQLVPLMRLNMGYCLNPIYWYEHYDWNLSRASAYASMLSNSEYNIPGHSIGYPRSKPYDWFQALYWNSSWVWAHWRRILLHESFFGLGLTIIGIGVSWYLISYILINLGYKLASSSQVQSTSSSSTTTAGGNNNNYDTTISLRTHRQTNITFKIISLLYTIGNYIGISTIGAIIGFFAVVITGYISYLLIPSHTAYYVAWPLFSIVLGLFQHTTLMWISSFLYYAANGADTWVDSNNIISNLDRMGGNNTNNNLNLPYNQSEWDLINKNAEKITSNPNSTLLSFIDEKTATLSPFVQKILLSNLIHLRTMLFHILLVACVYLINQYQIYADFAVKIICMFLGALYVVVAMVQPYTTLFLLFYYSSNGQYAWRHPSTMKKLC